MSIITRDIVEATGAISVVAGLLLVAYQINQTTKSIYYPNELTRGEILELDAYYIGG